MPSSIAAPEGQLSRRDKFRAYMQAFNPTAPAAEMIEAGRVCEDLHHYLFRNLAGRADLEPGSQQLLVGGVGSGKTTELLLAGRWLLGQGNVLPLYLDVSAETDLASLNAGSLLAAFGVLLGGSVVRDAEARAAESDRLQKLKEAHAKITEYAYGKEVKRRVEPMATMAVDPALMRWVQGYFVSEKVPGKLKPPLPVLNRDLQVTQSPLNEFLTSVRESSKDVVVIFDGLDRLLDAAKFWSVVHQDLRLLRRLKVSVIATAPLSVLFGVGVGQSISDHFDKIHHLTVIPSESAGASLSSVLERRRGTGLLPGLLPYTIVEFSGGVLRDLISLARDAAEEAYVSDRDSITLADIEKVANQLGNSYLRGLGPEAIETLLKLAGTKSIDLSKPENVELLLTRRVLEYSSTDFRVHPALLSVIPRPEPKRA